MCSTPESRLIDQAIKGGNEAFVALFLSVQDIARYAAIRYGATSDDLDDFIQEMRIRLWRKLSKFDGDIGSFRAWTHAVFRTVAIDISRVKVRHNRLRREWRPPEPSPLPDEIVAEADERMKFRRLAARIRSPTNRHAVTLRCFHDLTIEEMATVTGEKANALRARIYRGQREMIVTARRLAKLSNLI